jgi:sensor c-di-GMP phosphodiesterase-like protein
MKISKKVWLIVGAAIIVALLAIVFTIYFQQVRERQDLNERLDSATARSVKLTADKEDAENELAQAQSLLDTSQAQYPQEVHSIEYGEHIFEIIDDCNLTLGSLSFPKPSSTQVSLSLPVSGSVDNIFELIHTINTDDRFASTSINSINLNAGGGATISITIYIHKR